MSEIERRSAVPAGSGIRQAPFALRDNGDSEIEGDGWTLDGYGAVFNRMTVIDSWEGVFRERIAPGAMRKSFRENPPIVQFDHGRHPLIGSFPIANLRFAREEVDPELAPEGGAHIVADIFRHLFFEPLREAIAAKAVRGMSFRFSVVREKWETADGKVIRDEDELLSELRRTWSGDVPEEELPIRTLQELRVPEMGPVVWPAYSETSVSVRGKQVIDLAELDRDPETRVALARKLWAMPAVGKSRETQSRSDDAPQATVPEASAEQQSAQVASRDTAGEHPSSPSARGSDAPRSTDQGHRERAVRQRDSLSAGKHPSKPQPRERITKTTIARELVRSRKVLMSINPIGGNDA